MSDPSPLTPDVENESQENGQTRENSATPETPESIIESLRQQVEQLTAENTGLVAAIREKYVSLIQGITDKKGPLFKKILEAKKEFDSRFPKPTAPKPGIEKQTVTPLEALAAHEQIPPESKELFVKYMGELPPSLQARYEKRLQGILKQSKDEAALITALRGALFEMSRFSALVRQGLETIDPDAEAKIPLFSYYGYEKPKKDEVIDFRSAGMREFRDATIDLDVPIVRGDRVYIYETKSYSRMQYGSDAAGRNQLLKYQAAIEKGLVEGATVEIRGRVDKNALGWFMGERVGDFGAAPAVEIIYTFEMPSGKEYRFVLKRAEGREGLRFQNEVEYGPEDQAIIRGIQQALADKRIINIIGDVHIEPGVASDELRPFLDDPLKISSRTVYEEYARLQREAVTNKLRSIAEDAKINKDNKKSAVSSEFTTPTYIRHIIEEYQGFLLQNPSIAEVKGTYTLPEERIPEAVDHTMAIVRKIADFENSRATSSEEAAARVRRHELGYRGRAEGVALDVEHIMLDAMYSMNKSEFDRAAADRKIGPENVSFFFEETKSGGLRFRFDTKASLERAMQGDESLRKACELMPRRYRDGLEQLFKEQTFVRSYDWPERFQEIEAIPAYLETQDRQYMEIMIVDPQDTERVRFQKGITAVEKEKVAWSILKENVVRAEKKLENRSDYIHERQTLRNQLNTLETEWKQESAILEKQAQTDAKTAAVRVAELKRKRPEVVTKGNAEELLALDLELQHAATERERAFLPLREASVLQQQRVNEVYRKLEEVLRKIFSRREWESFTKRIAKTTQENTIKFIYVVTAEGNIITQEEILRGTVTGRAAHSELAQGRNVYGAGELAFEKKNGSWVLTEINNGSGHYRPDGDTTLPYVKNLLSAKGIDTTRATLVNSILRGAPLRDATVF